jgi:hypothetical protein
MKLHIPPGDFARYIFDCDGTLVDTMPLHFRAWTTAMQGAGLQGELNEELFYSFGGTPTRKVAQTLAKHHGRGRYGIRRGFESGAQPSQRRRPSRLRSRHRSRWFSGHYPRLLSDRSGRRLQSQSLNETKLSTFESIIAASLNRASRRGGLRARGQTRVRDGDAFHRAAASKLVAASTPRESWRDPPRGITDRSLAPLAQSSLAVAASGWNESYAPS